MTRTGEKILRCAQNDKGRDRMTREKDCHSVARFPLSVIRRRAPPPVILRSFAPKNLSYHVFVTGEKILRFAQNDKGRDRMTGERGCHSEARFPLSVILRRASPSLSFRAALPLLCHSEELRSEESFGPCPSDGREDSSLRSE